MFPCVLNFEITLQRIINIFLLKVYQNLLLNFWSLKLLFWKVLLLILLIQVKRKVHLNYLLFCCVFFHLLEISPFFYVVTFWKMELFVSFLYYSSNVCGISSDNFISNIDNLCHLSFLNMVRKFQLHCSFQTIFLFLVLLIFCHFSDFHFLLLIQFLICFPLALDLYCSSFYFLRQRFNFVM